ILRAMGEDRGYLVCGWWGKWVLSVPAISSSPPFMTPSVLLSRLCCADSALQFQFCSAPNSTSHSTLRDLRGESVAVWRAWRASTYIVPALHEQAAARGVAVDRPTELRRRKTYGAPAGGGREEEDTPYDGAASTLQHRDDSAERQRIYGVERPTELPPGAVAKKDTGGMNQPYDGAASTKTTAASPRQGLATSKAWRLDPREAWSWSGWAMRSGTEITGTVTRSPSRVRDERLETGPKSLTWLTDAGLNQGGAVKSWREHMAPQTFLGTVGSLEILGIREGVLLGLDGLCPPTTITERD
ncbi:hypothetical protein THAOC_08251, partial [Thalassiosira oceanica]